MDFIQVIKYVLILHLCSYLGQPVCNDQTIQPYEYSNFHDCITQGYIHSYKSLMDMDKDKIEKSKLAIRFECREVKINKKIDT